MLFVSGSEDPVGSYGKGVQQAVAGYKNVGIKDIAVKLYDGGRHGGASVPHEMLNETNREEVYADILAWIKKKTV